jgi:hypothetical protein
MEQSVFTARQPITLERISYLINTKGIDPVIAGIDLEMVKIKLQDTVESLGWSEGQCDDAEIEYKRFLHLNHKFPESPIVPHTVMDLMWHQHILDTRAYHKDCLLVFGGYFHHFPYFGIRSEDDKKNLDSAFSETQKIYSSEFGGEMINEDSSKCTRNCVSRCTRKCSS